MSKKTSHDLDKPTTAILAARGIVGQIGYIAGSIPYAQALFSDEAIVNAKNDQLLKDALEVEGTIHREHLAIQIGKVMDKSNLSLPRLCDLLNKQSTRDQVLGYAQRRHRSGGEHFDEVRVKTWIEGVRNKTKRIKASDEFRRVEDYRNAGAAHLSLDEYRTSMADMIEVAFDLFQVGEMLKAIFKNGVDERDLIGLYQYHLEAAKRHYKLTQPLDPLFGEMGKITLIPGGGGQ